MKKSVILTAIACIIFVSCEKEDLINQNPVFNSVELYSDDIIIDTEGPNHIEYLRTYEGQFTCEVFATDPEGDQIYYYFHYMIYNKLWDVDIQENKAVYTILDFPNRQPKLWVLIDDEPITYPDTTKHPYVEFIFY